MKNSYIWKPTLFVTFMLVGYLLLKGDNFPIGQSSTKVDSVKNTPTLTPTPKKPTDRALKAASYIFINSSESEQNKMIKEYEVEYGQEVVEKLALEFDEDNTKLIMAETFIEKHSRK